jgi:hypothetical protein
MRIATHEKIAGYPALKIRQFDARNGRSVANSPLRQGDSELHQFRYGTCLKPVGKAGFIEPVREYWEATTKGNALAMPTAAAPLRLETAERFD